MTQVPVNAWLPVAPCGSGPATPIVIAGMTTLTYVAAAGQTVFPLDVADRYGLTYTMTGAEDFAVYAGGARLALDDGTLFGGYTVDQAHNAIVLVNPAGAGEIVIVDIPATTTSDGGLAGPTAIATELPSVSGNVVVLQHTPDGQLMALFVNGRAFFAPASFTWTGDTITWSDPSYSLASSSVMAVYSYASS